MNRFKRELINKGVKLEHMYEMLPSPEGIQAVTVNSKTATFIVHHTSLSICWRMDRTGGIKEEWCY